MDLGGLLAERPSNKAAPAAEVEDGVGVVDLQQVCEAFALRVAALADLFKLLFGRVAPLGPDAGAEHVTDGVEVVGVPGVGGHVL